ncbi:MAG: DHA2 family efflux MFS transporter permease subunit [bacterium]
MEMIETPDEGSSNIDFKPLVNPWIIAFSVMLATFMEVLDTTVANVALPSIAGSFSASNEESTWALTSYLVSNAIVLPATAWLSSVFGRKNFFIGCIVLFSVASLLCGMADSLHTLIFMRILQGIGGGALQPVSQSILLESFPPNKRGLATAVFALGVVVAPILGPFLGGWITDNFSWRWIFFINLPVGIIATLMSVLYIRDTKQSSSQKVKSIDYIGFGLMALAIASLQIFLDKGQQLDWFSSRFITFTAITSLVSFIVFIIWELKVEEPIVNLKVFKNRNLTVGILSITALGAVLYGTIVLMPLFLQTILGYTAQLSGMAISPRGIGSFLCILVIGKFIDRYDGRIFCAVGFVILGIACFLLANINLSIDMASVVIPNILSGVAMGLIFVPLTTLSFGTLKQQEFGTAAGLFNLMRNIGGSVGISLVNTLLHRFSQTHQNYLVDKLNPYNPVFQQKVGQLTTNFSHYTDPAHATYLAEAVIHRNLIIQSTLSAFVDNLRLFGFLCFIVVPLAFLFNKVSKKKA